MSCKFCSEGKTRDCPEVCEIAAAQKSMMFSCLDASSMRFIPLYHDSTTCEKRPRACLGEDSKEANSPLPRFSMRFLPLYSATRDLSSTIHDLSPARVSESVSREEFATSTPVASSESKSSRDFQPTKCVVLNSSDSGILMDSPSLTDSSSGVREEPSRAMSSGLGKTISILRRSQSGLDVLNTPVSRDAKAVKSSVSRHLSPEFKKLEITEVAEKSSNCCPQQVERRLRGRHERRRMFRNSFKVSATSSRVSSTSRTSTTSGASKFKGNSTASALPKPTVWDGNNNETAEESSTMSAPKIHQLLDSNVPKSWCTFCKSNSETEDFMRSHTLKQWDPRARAYKLTCPVLRGYVCPICRATGDDAHTFTYCPVIFHEFGYRPKSLIAKIKVTSHDSSGRKRANSALQR